jgi:hypothetical protein
MYDFVTYVAFPSEVLVCFSTDERSNSSRFETSFASIARLEASRAARMSLLNLVAQLDASHTCPSFTYWVNSALKLSTIPRRSL